MGPAAQNKTDWRIAPMVKLVFLFPASWFMMRNIQKLTQGTTSTSNHLT